MPGLQILKFICALMVVQIHTHSEIKVLMIPICQIAVPVFFMISGYFLVDREGHITRKRIVSTFQKILKIAIISTAMYLFYKIARDISVGKGIDALLSIKFWLRQFAFGDNIGGHLWYLVAYLQSLIILYLLVRSGKKSYLIAFLILGLTLNLALGRYHFIFTDIYIPTYISRNAITIAIPCLIIGIMIRLFEHRLPSHKTIIIFLLISIILLYLESSLLGKYHADCKGDIVFFTVIVSTLTFLFFLRISPVGKMSTILAKVGKEYSLDIYIWHIFIRDTISNASKLCDFQIASSLIPTIIVTLIFAVAFTPMSRLSRLSFLNKIGLLVKS